MLLRMALSAVLVCQSCFVLADSKDETKARAKELRAKIESVRKSRRYQDLPRLQRQMLALPLTDKERIHALHDIGATFNHLLQRKKEAAQYYHEAIKLQMAALQPLTGIERAQALQAVERDYRIQLRNKQKADVVAREIVSLYRDALSSVKGAKALQYRGQIRYYLLQQNRNQPTDETRAWDKETQNAVIEHLKSIESLDNDKWLNALGDTSLIVTSLATDNEGTRIALESVADRIFALPASDKKFAAAQKKLMHTAANAAKKATDGALRKKAATYYRVGGAKILEGEALLRCNYDLDGARAAFASLPNDPTARDWLAMLAEEPTRAWQIDYAREELVRWVKRISGAAPDMSRYVLGTPETSDEAAAFARRHADDFARLADNDGFIIADEDGRVWIVASKTKGVLNGVYRFLEKNSDIIWVRELEGESENGFGTVYSKNPAFKNTIKYFVDVPALKIRYWTGNWSDAQNRWQARLLCNFRHPYDAGLGPAKYRRYATLGDMTSATLTLSLEMLKKYMYSDPDVFPLEKGKRLTYHDCQLCFMNPKTVHLFAEEAALRLSAVPKRVNDISIGLGDNWGLCQCPEWCMKPIKLADGSELQPSAPNFRSTQYALFVNRVYEKLKDRFPHLKPPRAQCYLFTAEAPAVRVIGGGGQYCPYVKNHKRPVYDTTVNAVWRKKAEDFRAAGMPFRALYEYYLCSSTPQFYHATMEVMQKDLLWYGDDMEECYNDVVYHDGPDGLEACGTGGVYDASAIEFYVCSRLMWNPRIDIAEARREFCRRAYKGAEDIMADYYEKMAKNYNEDPAGCFWNDEPVAAAKHYIVEKNLAPWLRETLTKAEAQATDPRSKELIRRHRVHIDYLVSLAEKAPPKVELAVGADWTAVAPLTRIKDASTPSDGKTKVWVKNDNHALYVRFDVENEKWRKLYDGFELERKVGKAIDMVTVFDWCNAVEIFIDGGLKASGSYYHLAFSMDGRRRTGFGSATATERVDWKVEIKPLEKGICAIVTLPFDQLGIEISKDNKVGMMFVANNTAWNGGQWHSPTAFQILKLGMR